MASFSDDFNRADGGLGANWGGAGAALWAVSSNVASKNNGTDGMPVWQSPASTVDHSASITVLGAGTGSGYPNVMARVATAANTFTAGTFYGFYTRDTTGDAGIYKAVGGTITVILNLSSTLVVPSAPFTMTLRVNGNQLTAYINDVQVGQITDTAITSGLYAGFSYGDALGAARTIDDFAFGDLASEIGFDRRRLVAPGFRSPSSLKRTTRRLDNTGTATGANVTATADGTSATSATATATVEHVVTVAGTSSTSATATATPDHPATAAGSSATTGTVTATVEHPVTASGSSATGGTVSATVEVAATAAGTSATSATSVVTITVTVTGVGTSATSGDVVVIVCHLATADGTSTTNGTAIAVPATGWGPGSACLTVDAPTVALTADAAIIVLTAVAPTVALTATAATVTLTAPQATVTLTATLENC